jgi:hypothetical protein
VSDVTLWNEASCATWDAARAEYGGAIEASGGSRLVELDRWYHGELPALLAGRDPAFLTLSELVRVVEWKMHRGVYRARNLVLVRGNEADQVEAASREAIAAAPHPTAPIARLSRLKGVGPATASALLAAARPDVYPFFDDVIAGAIPELGRVDFTLKVYARYAERLRERAALLAVGCPSADWTPHAVGCALWAAAGGKAG